VVIDAAFCTSGLLDDAKNYLDETRRARLGQITLLGSIAWCDSLFPALTVTMRVERAAVHPTCSTAHLGLTKTLERLAARLAGEVLVPVGTTCCGTAGDRGLLHPELVASPPARRRQSWMRCRRRPTCRPTAPAKWACARPPATRTSRLYSCWRN
jgi:D-lactate dehydrogenase